MPLHWTITMKSVFGLWATTHLDHHHRSIDDASVTLGAVVSRYSNDLVIASLQDVWADIGNRDLSRGCPSGKYTLLANGWLRYNAHDTVDRHHWLTCSTEYYESWLTQANYIFDCCQIGSGMEDYVSLQEVDFGLHVSAITVAVPAGFLFLCPPDDFRAGPSSFCWPNCPAYWSLDPMGIGRLSTEEAREYGFPELTFSTTIYGRYWDASVYAGLRKFYQAKGFDPYSQDLARHLGCPLFQPSGDIHAPFAHIDDNDAAHNLEADVRDWAMDVDDNKPEPSEDLPGMDLSW
ncbi:hypothetical protein C8R47DRAFT_48470 [Mycena vitilis]|nr:hypothetical protein C8R47DRAFT_48470 [Mycena vitilis]